MFFYLDSNIDERGYSNTIRCTYVGTLLCIWQGSLDIIKESKKKKKKRNSFPFHCLVVSNTVRPFPSIEHYDISLFSLLNRLVGNIFYSSN